MTNIRETDVDWRLRYVLDTRVVLIVRTELDDIVGVSRVTLGRGLNVCVRKGIYASWFIGKSLLNVLREENYFVQFSIHESVEFLSLVYGIASSE